MDMVTKIITLIGGIIGLSSAAGLILGIRDIRSGMAHDDPRTLDKGIQNIVVSGVVLTALGGIVAYVIIQAGKIQF